MAENAVSGAQVLSLLRPIESKFGVRYPREFVEHLAGPFPGIFIEVKESVWPRPKEYDVGPFWSFLYALHTFTPVGSSDDWMRLDFAAESFRDRSGLIAAPVLKLVGDADLFCALPDGQLAEFRHDTNELVHVKLDFWELFEREVAELRARKDQKKREGLKQ